MYGATNIDVLKNIYDDLESVVINMNIHLLTNPNIALSRIRERGIDNKNICELNQFNELYYEFLPKSNLYIDSSHNIELIHENLIRELLIGGYL